jgi:hypothetical protein
MLLTRSLALLVVLVIAAGCWHEPTKAERAASIAATNAQFEAFFKTIEHPPAPPRFDPTPAMVVVPQRSPVVAENPKGTEARKAIANESQKAHEIDAKTVAPAGASRGANLGQEAKDADRSPSVRKPIEAPPEVLARKRSAVPQPSRLLRTTGEEPNPAVLRAETRKPIAAQRPHKVTLVAVEDYTQVRHVVPHACKRALFAIDPPIEVEEFESGYWPNVEVFHPNGRLCFTFCNAIYANGEYAQRNGGVEVSVLLPNRPICAMELLSREKSPVIRLNGKTVYGGKP